MKSKWKFNNGNGATLCHKCTTIISVGFTQDLICDKCLHNFEESFEKSLKFYTIENEKSYGIFYKGQRIKMPSGKVVWNTKRAASNALSNGFFYSNDLAIKHELIKKGIFEIKKL